MRNQRTNRRTRDAESDSEPLLYADIMDPVNEKTAPSHPYPTFPEPSYGHPVYGQQSGPQYAAPPTGYAPPPSYSQQPLYPSIGKQEAQPYAPYDAAFAAPHAGASVPLAEVLIPPPGTSATAPVLNASEYHDFWWGVAFWVHAAIIVILGFALGIPALTADAQQRPGRTNLDFNSKTMVNAVVTA
jgi:hypothetical protein